MRVPPPRYGSDAGSGPEAATQEGETLENVAFRKWLRHPFA